MGRLYKRPQAFRLGVSNGLISSEQEPELVEAKYSRDRAPKKRGVNDAGVREKIAIKNRLPEFRIRPAVHHPVEIRARDSETEPRSRRRLRSCAGPSPCRLRRSACRGHSRGRSKGRRRGPPCRPVNTGLISISDIGQVKQGPRQSARAPERCQGTDEAPGPHKESAIWPVLRTSVCGGVQGCPCQRAQCRTEPEQAAEVRQLG
jgi:hypothetical protein